MNRHDRRAAAAARRAEPAASSVPILKGNADVRVAAENGMMAIMIKTPGHSIRLDLPPVEAERHLAEVFAAVQAIATPAEPEIPPAALELLHESLARIAGPVEP
jgi:hypothetical protein